MSALTRRQRETLDAISDFIRRNRYSPSLDEIARVIGVRSSATVHKHVANLERKGFIKRDKFFGRNCGETSLARSIDVVGPPPTGRAAHCSGCRCEERIVAEVEEAVELNRIEGAAPAAGRGE